MRLSVGTRWTLRYALAMFATSILLALLVFDRVERRFEQDATLLLDLQLEEVRAALERHPGAPEELEAWLDQKLAAAAEIGLGVALYDLEGRVRLAGGVLETFPFPPNAELLAEVEEEGFAAVHLGRRYPHFLTVLPVTGGLLEVAIYARPFERRTEHIAKVLQIAVPALVVLTLGLGWWLTRRSLRPIAEITSTARRITGAHLEEWIPTAGTGDELDRLAETLNDMMARIRTAMERSREFQTRLARELRAPLLALQREIAALSEDESLSSLGRRRLARALEDTESLAESIHALLRLAWTDGGCSPAASVPVPLSVLLEEAAANVAGAAQRRQVALSLGPLAGGSVAGDPFWLHQLFDSLFEAAVASLPEGGTVAAWSEAPAGPGPFRVGVRAQPGAGAAGAAKGDSAGSAASARLALAREIARAHSGRLVAEDGAAGELELHLELPGA
jgi:two-component system OmpR family sensor kinase